LDSIASRVYIGGSLPNTPQNLMTFLMHPHGTNPKTAMHEMGIPPRDERDIAAYLYTLKQNTFDKHSTWPAPRISGRRPGAPRSPRPSGYRTTAPARPQ